MSCNFFFLSQRELEAAFCLCVGGWGEGVYHISQKHCPFLLLPFLCPLSLCFYSALTFFHVSLCPLSTSCVLFFLINLILSLLNHVSYLFIWGWLLASFLIYSHHSCISFLHSFDHCFFHLSPSLFLHSLPLMCFSVTLCCCCFPCLRNLLQLPCFPLVSLFFTNLHLAPFHFHGNSQWKTHSITKAT